MSDSASHCTIELVHGGTIHVGEPMDKVSKKIYEARYKRDDIRGSDRARAGFVALKRIEGDPAIPKNSRNWLEFEVDANAIIAIFPIDQASVPVYGGSYGS